MALAYKLIRRKRGPTKDGRLRSLSIILDPLEFRVWGLWFSDSGFGVAKTTS